MVCASVAFDSRYCDNCRFDNCDGVSMSFYLSKTSLKGEILYCIRRIQEEKKKVASFTGTYLWHGFTYQITVTVKKRRPE